MTNEELWTDLSESGLFDDMNETLWDSYPVVRCGEEVWVPRQCLTLEERAAFVEWLRKTAERQLLCAIESECALPADTRLIFLIPDP